MSRARPAWSYARPRAGPVDPEPARPGPGQLPWCRGAGTGWYRRTQAVTIQGRSWENVGGS